MTLSKPPTLEEAAASANTPLDTPVQDRRRSGRPDQVSPHLIPLLRDAGSADVPPSDMGAEDAPDLAGDLAPIVGIIIALVLSAALWAVLVGAGWWMLR